MATGLVRKCETVPFFFCGHVPRHTLSETLSNLKGMLFETVAFWGVPHFSLPFLFSD